MGPLVTHLLSTGGIARQAGNLGWHPATLLLQAGSDSLVALACCGIALTLLYVLWQRLPTGQRWVTLPFAVFLMACGATRLMDLLALWEPAHWTQGAIQAVTAVTALLCATLLWPLVPRMRALPTPTQLDDANRELQRQIASRERLEAELGDIRSELERRVQVRTHKLEQAQKALQDQMAERIRADSMKDELLAAVGRELRTPLTSIGGSLHLLYADRTSPPQVREELVGIALRNCERVTRLVNRLLALDRIRSSRMAFASEPLSLVELARTAVREHEALALQRGCRLVLVRGEEAGPIRGDEERLTQAMSDLIASVIDDAPAGSTVTVAVAPVPGCTRVSVETKVPQDGETDDRCQADPAEGTGPGTIARTDGLGMGLSIVRAIVERHGGRVGSDSSAGAGKGFYFEVPLRLDLITEARFSPAGLDADDRLPC